MSVLQVVSLQINYDKETASCTGFAANDLCLLFDRVRVLSGLIVENGKFEPYQFLFCAFSIGNRGNVLVLQGNVQLCEQVIGSNQNDALGLSGCVTKQVATSCHIEIDPQGKISFDGGPPYTIKQALGSIIIGLWPKLVEASPRPQVRSNDVLAEPEQGEC